MQLNNKYLKVPLIQGGMGIGISLGKLAGSVMKEGAMGVISAAQPGYLEDDFFKNPLQCNLRQIDEQAKTARKISQEQGLLGLNIMHASSHYEKYCFQAEKSGYDAILSGAGLALDLPKYVSENILIAPIVSSAKALDLILRVWKKKYSRKPDFIVVEGSLAGGHLGFSKTDLLENTCKDLKSIVKEVKERAKDIPVFAAGGIFDHKDVKEIMEAGADGVQAATRFIATYECDAPQEFKKLLIDAGKEDIFITDSPAGLPARAIKTKFSQNLNGDYQNNLTSSRCTGCLKKCAHEKAVYCISHALMHAARGNLEDGLFFTGANAWKIKKMESVKEVIEDMMYE